MEINSANSFTPQATASLAVDNQVRVTAQADRLVTNEAQNKTEQENQQSQRQTRFDVDEQTLAVLEQEQKNLSSGASAQSASNSTAYDQPSPANQTAVSAYQSVDNIVKRESIEQAFGVDLYA